MIKTRYKKGEEGKIGVSVKLSGPLGMIFKEIEALIEETNKAITTFILDDESRICARIELIDRIDEGLRQIKNQAIEEAIDKEKDLPEGERKLTILREKMKAARRKWQTEIDEIEKDAKQAEEDELQADISEIEFVMKKEQEKE